MRRQPGVEFLRAHDVLVVAVLIERKRTILRTLGGYRVPIEPGEARDERIRNRPNGVGALRGQLIETGDGEDDDRRAAVVRPPAVEIQPVIVAQPVTGHTGEDVDAELGRLVLQPVRDVSAQRKSSLRS